jgi:uncharacterized membrane protein SpoIIM required for sporulation
MMDRYLVNSMALILLCVFFGFVCGWLYPAAPGPASDPWENARQLHSQGWLTTSRLHFLLAILLHNALVLAILCASGVISGGLASLLYFLGEGINFGRMLHPGSEVPGGLAALFLLVTPHGVIEMSAFVLAAASTLSAGAHLFRTILGKPELETWRSIGITLLRMYGLSLGLVITAAIVEACVTPEFGMWMKGVFSLQ